MKTKKTTPKKLLNEDVLTQLKTATKVLRSIDNKFRLKILEAIHKLGEPNVTEIYTALDMQQEICSINLKKLRDIGLVTYRRENKLVYYKINHEKLSNLLGTTTALSKYFEGGDKRP